MGFEFRCQTCGETHKGMPSFATAAPRSYYAIPEAERASRCGLGTDDCVIDETFFFVRGCLEIPVLGEDEPFVWGVWASLSKQDFITWLKVFDVEQRSHVGPFFGWLDTWLRPYPETMNLKTRVHLRDHGVRPSIELEPTDHPLAREQRNGISADRAAEIYAIVMHGPDH